MPLLRPALLAAALLCAVLPAAAQHAGPDRVLSLMWEDGGARALPQDAGAAGLWQRLLKLRTTGSVLHITAHPDDENGGVLAYLSRGQGTRTALLSLNRGEGGANAVGSELFDALGLVRTEELLLAGSYYGLDDLYFTTLIDYGFSKNLEESLRQWGHEEALRDVVRVIRINRPLVLLARFHGSERDGHGNHQAAGLLAQEAFAAAGDPARFPEQITEEGLRPWQPLKLYRRVREEETPNLVVDAGTYSPWLGTSYRNFAAQGLSLQRSQVGGRYREVLGPSESFYERLGSRVEAPAREATLFDGIDTSLPALFTLAAEPAPGGAAELLRTAEADIESAVAAYRVDDPAAAAKPLAAALRTVRRVLDMTPDRPEAHFLLQVKERQLMDAVNAALGIRLTAVGVPAGTAGDASPWAPLATMGPVVPGQDFTVTSTLHNPSGVPVTVESIALSPDWRAERTGASPPPEVLEVNTRAERDFAARVPEDAPYGRRYFYRDDIQQSRYAVRDSAQLHLPHGRPALAVAARYAVEGEPVEIRETVRTRQADLPYGYSWHTLKTAPAVAVNLSPETRMVPVGEAERSIDMEVELINNVDGPVEGTLRLETPAGWRVEPSEQPFAFAHAGERARFVLAVHVPEVSARDYEVRAVATAGGRTYDEGYQIIRHRDNDTNYLYRPATTRIRGVDVAMAEGLDVGYVMGVGDEVPAGIEQLGASVELLGSDALARGDLERFDAIVVGTRAYAVRDDLRTYNRRLLEYARRGGHLIVLYQTPEFVPEQMAPHPATLPRSAEEVSEEDAPVRVLAPDHPIFHHPNRITAADFDGWIEQRGSKFFATWDPAYTAMIETQDHGQAPQQGGWLVADVGDGTYTYFAYAIHRQVPYAVPGAYRLFANLLSLGQ